MKTRILIPTILCALAALQLWAQSQTGTPLWIYDAGTLIKSSPALAADGTVYFAAGSNLHAVTNNGSVASNKWLFPVGNGEAGSPAIASDGIILVASHGSGFLYAVDSNGAEKWKFPTGGGFGSPAIAADNTIFTSAVGDCYAVKPDGSELWKYPIGGAVKFGSPSIGASGVVFVPSPQVATFYSFTPAGGERWHFTFEYPNEPRDSAAIGANGTIFLPADGIYAFSEIGSNIWTAYINQFVPSSPAIGPDGTIYVTVPTYEPPFLCYGFSLCALNSSGAIAWQFNTNRACRNVAGTTPAIDSSGVIYFVYFDTLFALRSNGTLLWAYSVQGDPADPNTYSYTAPAIGADGTIYATFGSKLYAIANTNGLADSAWPMYRGNARHTGKIEKPALKQPKKRADANFEFQLFAQLGQTNVIETTTNLNMWTSLTSVVVTTVPQPVVDLSASNHPTRFYRSSTP